MNTTISPDTFANRTYDVVELAPRASRVHVGQVAAVSRSAGSVHITMTEAAAEDLAAELSFSVGENDLGDMWSQIGADLRTACDLDAELIPPSKWQSSVTAGFDGSPSDGIAIATLLRTADEIAARR